MTLHPFHLTPVLILSLGLMACSSPPPSPSEQKIAELEKELDAAKQALADKSQAPGAPAEPGVAAGQPATGTSPPSPADADAAARAAKAAQDEAAQTADKASQAATEATRARTTAERALAEQQAASARQSQENAELRRQLDEMKPREFTLPTDTVLPVRTTAEISTKTMKQGSVFDALLERDLVVDDTVLAKAGSTVTCIVSSSDPGGKVKGVASLAVRVQSIAGVNGNTITVRTNSYAVEAKSTARKDAARTGIAAGAGAAIGAIAGGGKGAAIGAGVGAAGGAGVALATRGEPAVIPTETLIEFRLAAPATVVFRK